MRPTTRALAAVLALAALAAGVPAAAGAEAAESEGGGRTPGNPYVKPLAEIEISAVFGARGPLWSTGQHTGLDLRAPEGTPVYALTAGRVIQAGTGPRWAGTVVVIRTTDGREIWNAHLTKATVEEGQQVQAGDRIGSVGSTGNSTGAHLHLGIWADGEWVNPAPLVRVGDAPA